MDDAQLFYVVMPLTEQFRKEHYSAWRRLVKTESIRLHLFDAAEDMYPAGDW